MSKKDKQPSTSGDPSSMGSEARIQHLEAEVQRLHREQADAASRAASLRADILGLTALAETGGAEEMVTEEGKAARAAVAGAISERKALRSDLMVLEQTAAGTAPNIALQTEPGKKAAHALSEVLTMMDKMNEQGLEGDALPAFGWSSPRAKALVEAVQAQPGLRSSDARALLLGDLLEQLAPHAGETGANETASDVLKRALAERRQLTDLTADVQQIHNDLEARMRAQSERMAKLQDAMVARRAPDAEAGTALERMSKLLDAAMVKRASTGGVVDTMACVLNEWQGLRSFLSPAPLTALAIRTDASPSTPERYTVLLLEWDGTALNVSTFEKGEPWQDVAPHMRQLVDSALVPAPFRSRG